MKLPTPPPLVRRKTAAPKGTALPAPAKGPPTHAAGLPQVYIAYSRKDRTLVEQFRTFVETTDAPLRLFYDLDVQAGAEWDAQLRSNLEASRAVVFFLSPDAMTANYIWSVEVPAAMSLAAQGRTSVLPVLLHECPWKETPLARFQMLPRDLRPVAATRPRTRAWQELLDELLITVIRPEAAPALPDGTERLQFALYAVLEQPAELALLERLDASELSSLWQRLIHDADSTEQAFKRLAQRHGAVQPHPLWAAWIATVHPDKLGL